MKVLALLIVVAGLVIAIVPQSTNCEARSDAASTAPGDRVAVAATFADDAGSGSLLASMQTVASSSVVTKMKCFWSARGGLVVGIMLVVAGGLLYFARRRETRRALAIVTACLGLFAILVPVSLIGTCGAATMICNTTMKPVMMIAGGIAVAASVAVLVVNELRREEPTETAAG